MKSTVRATLNLVTYLESTITVVKVNEMVYFKANDVADILGYKDRRYAIYKHVDEDDKVSYKKLQKNITHDVIEKYNLQPKTMFINESGVYSLILRCKLPSAKEFKHWITSELLPTLRQKGKYKVDDDKLSKKCFLKIESEFDLQYNVVKYLRNYYPDVLFTAPLGENQDSEAKRLRSYLLGFTGGMPDLLVFEPSGPYCGLAIEIKSPTGKGVITEKQIVNMTKLQNAGWKCVCSNDYIEIIHSIDDYFNKMNVDQDY